MKKSTLIGTVLLSTLAFNTFANNEIIVSKKVKKSQRELIENDLEVLKNLKFVNPEEETLKILELSSLTGDSATKWLNDRVSYIVHEKALSLMSLLLKTTVYTASKNVTYPNNTSLVLRHDEIEKQFIKLDDGVDTDLEKSLEENNKFDKSKSYTVMSNIGTGLYMSGKQSHVQYGMKISRGFLKSKIHVEIESPRTGIIQIGEGLFAKELAVNQSDAKALSNSVDRLATFFHEARHSDGNGESLGFGHAKCPATHDYANEYACDSSTNGSYKVGFLMLLELTKAALSTNQLTPRDLEVLKLQLIDNATRFLPIDAKGKPAHDLDPRPERIK